MTLYSKHEIARFMDIVRLAKGDVWMQDARGRCYDLRNELTLYRTVGLMLENPDNDLELYATDYDTQLRLEAFIVNQRMGRVV